MKKFIVCEIGSTNTKTSLFNNGEITEFTQVTIPFKGNFKNGKLDDADIAALCAHINKFKSHTPEIFAYGTSIFRELGATERARFLAQYKSQTGRDFNIVSAAEECELTVAGVLSGNDYRGRLAVMVVGGASTEVCIVENRKIIEHHLNNYGSYTVTCDFPKINDFHPALDMKTLDAHCEKLAADISNRAEILVIAGGDFLYFYRAAGKEFLEPNKFYADKSQPLLITKENADIVDRRFVFDQDIAHYQKNFPDYSPTWWSGARAMRFCVRGVAKKCGAKFLIPTKINMLIGVIAQLKS